MILFFGRHYLCDNSLIKHLLTISIFMDALRANELLDFVSQRALFMGQFLNFYLGSQDRINFFRHHSLFQVKSPGKPYIS